MIRHRNYYAMTSSIERIDDLWLDEDVMLLYLPLAHNFGRLMTLWGAYSGFTIAFCPDPYAVAEVLPQVRPTLLPSVPRLYEKAFSSVVGSGLAQEGPAGTLFRTAMQEFELYADAKEKGQAYSSSALELARKLVFPEIRQKLSQRFGGRIRAFVSGGAPLAHKIACFFDLLGFNLLEGYGLTETLGITSVNLPGQNKLGTVGRLLPGIEVKIAADGEILERGRQIMLGYLGMPEATSEVIDREGWFHTGDIGELDADGYLRITDRKKDLIKTSGGKYIAPQAIEGALKGESELINQVVVVGDRRKYVSVLITVVEDRAKTVAAEAGEPAATYRDAASSKAVRTEVQDAIDRMNATLPSFETVKRFTILEHELSLESGELTPSLKVKRKIATEEFKPQIDAMYDGESYD